VQLERRVIARLKTANIRFTDAQVKRIWAMVSAHQAGLSIRKIAGATGLSSSRIHQLLNAPEAKEIPVWLSQLRQSSRGSGGKKKRPESETEIRSGLAREVEMLRRCIDWLQRLERGENVVVNRTRCYSQVRACSSGLLPSSEAELRPGCGVFSAKPLPQKAARVWRTCFGSRKVVAILRSTGRAGDQ
jgi:hypothetical protein